MKLVLLRHAEKMQEYHNNPSLSSRGQAQARKLLEKLQNLELPRPQILLASPKIRTQQTLAQISEWTQIPVQIEPLLEERQSHPESAQDFLDRIETFKNNLINQVYATKSQTCVYACTHMDWVEVFIESLKLQQAPRDWEPWMSGQYLIVNYVQDSGGFHTWELQSWGRINT